MSTAYEGEFEEKIEVVTNLSTRIQVLDHEIRQSKSSSFFANYYNQKSYAFVSIVRRYIWVQAFLL